MIEIRTDAGLAEWFSQQAGGAVSAANAQFFGLVVNGEVRAVFALGRIIGADAELGVVTLPGTRWPRAFLNLIFDYAFRQCGLSTSTGQDCSGLSKEVPPGEVLSPYDDCRSENAGTETGTVIGAGLVIGLWVAIDFILAVSYGIYRLAKRK